MKHLLLITAFIFLSALHALASCPEPILSEFSKPLANKEINVKSQWQNKNFKLKINASAEKTFWGKKDAESAVLTVFLDGKYHQDIFLFKGSEDFSYQMALGKLPLGKHRLAVFINPNLSAKTIGKVKLNKIDVKPAEISSAEDEIAQAHTPFFYARPDTIGKFSDIPLLVYYEILPGSKGMTKVRYSVIYTNEDGGTQTTALLARWGRTTDIEWVYEIDIKDGSVNSAIIQLSESRHKNFKGKRIYGNHPLMFDVTVNNNFPMKAARFREVHRSRFGRIYLQSREKR